MNTDTPIIIPSYEPDGRLLALLHQLLQAGFSTIIIVDDGSGDSYRSIFAEAERLIQPTGVLLSYPENQGKGYALKTAFRYVLEQMPDAAGVITADSDGQHTTECIGKVREGLLQNPGSLILGVRAFDGEGIPWKSRFGNKLTRKVMKYVSGIDVSDTQTGLRGIPTAFLADCLAIRQNRFEYEMEMLLLTTEKNIPITEVPIATIYDSAENHQTHFNPFVDSVRIYGVLGRKFLAFIFSSLSSSLIDLAFFTLFCHFLKAGHPEGYIILSTAFARIISCTYNFAVNYKTVFKSSGDIASSAAKYVLLAVVQMSCSALLVNGGSLLLPKVPETVIKIIVDTLLFFASYKIQQKFVFRGKKKTA